ncbi:MAG: trigger factor [Bacteroidales bacterium]|nr:trigger factor [Bacteroidales bacterium]
MKVSQENNGVLTLLVKVELEANDYKPEVEKQLKEQRKKMTMPGFRPGQVPMPMVKKMYGTAVKAQTIEQVMSDSLYRYIEDNKIKVLGSPLANDDKTPKADFEKDDNFTFYFDVAQQPEFDLDLNKHSATLYEIEPTKEMLDKFIEDTCMRFGKVESPETIGEKDMAYGHLVELNEDGEPKEGGVDINTTLYIERIALKTIKDKFLNKKKDDTITFKPSKALKDPSQLATFLRKKQEEAKEFSADCKFTVSSIQRMTPAELNEDLFNKVYKDKGIKDEKSFREEAKKDLMNAYKRESDNYFLNKTSEELVKNVKFDLPVEFLKRWLIATSQSEQAKQDIENKFDKYLDGIRWQILETKIAEDNNVKVIDEDVVNYYKTELLPSYFPAMPDETEEQKKEREEHLDSVAHNMLREQEQTKQVYNYLFDKQISDALKQKMNIEVKKVNMDDFIKEVTPNSDETTPAKEEKKVSKKKSLKAEKKEEVNEEPSLF